MKNKSSGEEKKVSVLLTREIVVFAHRRRRKNHGKYILSICRIEGRHQVLAHGVGRRRMTNDGGGHHLLEAK